MVNKCTRLKNSIRLGVAEPPVLGLADEVLHSRAWKSTARVLNR